MKYLVKVGINYPGKNGKEKRAEAGEVVSDLPQKSIGWLVEQGIVEPAEGSK